MKRSPVSEPHSVTTAGPAPLFPGDIVEIECTDLIAKSGQAVGRARGMVVYVLGPVPGERARVRIEVVKARYAVGELIELLTCSESRAEPFCSVFGACGGCQVQHLRYDAQLRWKCDIVVNALRRIGGIGHPRVGATIGMDDPRAYRNKMALVVDTSEGARTFGFYAARTHDVVPIVTCPIVAPELDSCISGLVEAIGDTACAPVFEGARHVVARTGSERVAISISTERAWHGPIASAQALARRLPGVVGILNSYEPSSENAILGRRQATLTGTAQVEATIEGIRYRVSPASFFQVNTAMVGKIFAYLEPHLRFDRVVDWYCGIGTFALFFAKRGARVNGIDEHAGAIREARANAQLNGVEDRVAFSAERAEAAVRKPAFLEALAASDIAFLDPPRKGVEAHVLAGIAGTNVPHVWYLSCNPATLARDVAQLVTAGYELDGVQPFDMFPQTGHVEALAILRRTGVISVGFPFAEAA